jgi:hypothetical protein
MGSLVKHFEFLREIWLTSICNIVDVLHSTKNSLSQIMNSHPAKRIHPHFIITQSVQLQSLQLWPSPFQHVALRLGRAVGTAVSRQPQAEGVAGTPEAAWDIEINRRPAQVCQIPSSLNSSWNYNYNCFVAAWAWESPVYLTYIPTFGGRDIITWSTSTNKVYGSSVYTSVSITAASLQPARIVLIEVQVALLQY